MVLWDASGRTGDFVREWGCDARSYAVERVPCKSHLRPAHTAHTVRARCYSASNGRHVWSCGTRWGAVSTYQFESSPSRSPPSRRAPLPQTSRCARSSPTFPLTSHSQSTPCGPLGDLQALHTLHLRVPARLHAPVALPLRVLRPVDSVSAVIRRPMDVMRGVARRVVVSQRLRCPTPRLSRTGASCSPTAGVIRRDAQCAPLTREYPVSPCAPFSCL